MRALATLSVATLLIAPITALAFPFGGQISQVVPCYNKAIYAYRGPPRGRPCISTPATKTYQFGPPAFVGQWLLGLASVPYYCLVSIEPVIVWSGTAISMMGSSGPTAPGVTYSQNGVAGFAAQPSTGVYTSLINSGASQGPGSTVAAGGPTGSSGLIGHVVISEAFFNVDQNHGSKPENEWVELYNGSSASVDLSGWQISDNASASVLPVGTMISPASYRVVSYLGSTALAWSIPNAAQFVALGAPLGNGLANAGDVVRLNTVSG